MCLVPLSIFCKLISLIKSVHSVYVNIILPKDLLQQFQASSLLDTHKEQDQLIVLTCLSKEVECPCTEIEIDSISQNLRVIPGEITNDTFEYDDKQW